MKTPHTPLRPASRIGAGAAALALLLLAAPPLHAQDSLADDPGVAEALHLLDIWMDAARAYGGIPGASLSVVHDQELVWAKGYGYAHMEREEPATPSTMLLHLLHLQALHRGRRAATARPGKGRSRRSRGAAPRLVPDPGRRPGGGLRYRRRAAHPYLRSAARSGRAVLDRPRLSLPDARGDRRHAAHPVDAVSPAHLLPVLQSGTHPGRRDRGGGVRAGLRRLHPREHPGPAGDVEHFTDLEDRFRDNRLASGYTARGRDGKRQLVPDYSVRGISPAAGFVSTVEDLGRFASWQFRVLDGDDALLDRNTLREMHRVHWLEPDGDTTYGLGFSVWKSDGDTFVGHGGSCPGYRSHLLLRPQDEVATAFMTNGQGVDSRRFAQTAYDIVAPALREAAGKPDGEIPAGAGGSAVEGGATAARETLMRFTGIYQRPFGGESAVLIREGDLHVLSLPTDDPLDSLTRLRHIEDGTFRRVRDNDDLGEEFTFEQMPDGRMLMWRNDNYSIRAGGI